MIKAKYINEKVEKARQKYRENELIKEQQKKNDRINLELLEVEKAINFYDKNITKMTVNPQFIKFISVPILISRDVQDILENEGYLIEKDISNLNETKLFFNEDDCKKYNSNKHKHDINIPINHEYEDITSIPPDVCKEAYKALVKSSENMNNNLSKEPRTINNIGGFTNNPPQESKSTSQEQGYKSLSEDIKTDKMSVLNNENMNRCLNDIRKEAYELLTNIPKQENLRNKKQLILLNSKLEAKQQEFKTIEILIENLINRERYFPRLDIIEKYHKAVDKIVEVGKEISKIRLEINKIESLSRDYKKFEELDKVESFEDAVKKLYPSIKIYRF